MEGGVFKDLSFLSQWGLPPLIALGRVRWLFKELTHTPEGPHSSKGSEGKERSLKSCPFPEESREWWQPLGRGTL